MNSSWRSWKTVLLLSVTLCAPGFMAASCFSKLNIPVDIEKSFEFDVDVDKYVLPALQKAGIQQTSGQIPQGAPTVTIPVEYAQLVDISKEPAITQVGNKLTAVNINSMLVSATLNTLTAPLPGFTVVMGEKEGKPTTAVANLSGIPKEKTGVLEDLVKSGAQTAVMSNYILNFAFQVGVTSNLVLKPGDTIPRGRVNLKVTMKLTVRVAPFK